MGVTMSLRSDVAAWILGLEYNGYTGKVWILNIESWKEKDGEDTEKIPTERCISI